MFENIVHASAIQTQQITVADSLDSGEEVGYFVTFMASEDCRLCGMVCSVMHSREAIAHDGFVYDTDKTSTISG